MQLHKLLSDDEAVSPVIGVILMVAITVILAAVIASFVLGIGDQQEVQPQAQFDFDYDASASNVTITHTNGDSIPNSSVVIRGQSIDQHGTGSDISDRGWQDPRFTAAADLVDWNGTASGSIDGQEALEAGDSVTVDVEDDSWTVRVVWQSSSGGSSATLASESGPAA